MMSERRKIDLISRISLDINEVKDIDLLLERILSNVRRFFNADAGSIYLKQGDHLTFSYTQNDTLQQRLGPDKKLIYKIFSIPINNQSIAGYVAENRKPLNISDVYQLNKGVPFTFDSHFDNLTDYKTRSMLTVPISNQRNEVLGVMQIINAKDSNGHEIPFSHQDEPFIMHFATSAGLAVERAQMTRNIILRMISMAELRDPKETGAHANRVGAYSLEIFEEYARKKHFLPEDTARQKDLLRMAAMLHDVGKVAISDMILKKPSRLTAEEFEIMKTHTYLGARLFKGIQSDFDEVALTVALNHHEKWDGTGYPGHVDPFSVSPMRENGKADQKNAKPKNGEDIPLFGRIVAIADVYDALSSWRPYKSPWDENRIVEEIHNLSGKHFDPEVVDAFFTRLDIMKSIAKRYPEDESV